MHGNLLNANRQTKLQLNTLRVAAVKAGIQSLDDYLGEVDESLDEHGAVHPCRECRACLHAHSHVCMGATSGSERHEK